jgi:hypothetical protein
MIADPLALLLRDLPTLVEVAVHNDSTVVFPASLIGLDYRREPIIEGSVVGRLGGFLARVSEAASERPVASVLPTASTNRESVL